MAQSQSKEITWTTVSEDPEELVKVSFDYIGAEFIGYYKGSKQLRNDEGSYVQYRFAGQGDDPQTYFINGGFTLREAMAKVRAGSLVRITYVDDRDTGQTSLMKVYRVDVGR